MNFDATTVDEEKFLKREFYKKIIDKICPSEDISIEKNDLVKIINKNFPDFRSTLIDLDNFKHSGSLGNSFQVNLKLISSTIDMIMTKSVDYETIYNFLITNYGPERITELIEILGKPLIDYCIENKKETEKLFKANYIVCDYSLHLEKSTDPIVLGMTIVGKLRELFAD